MVVSSCSPSPNWPLWPPANQFHSSVSSPRDWTRAVRLGPACIVGPKGLACFEKSVSAIVCVSVCALGNGGSVCVCVCVCEYVCACASGSF